MFEIKDIFIDAFSLSDSLIDKPIIEQLVHMVDKIKDEDIETNVKLLEWSECKFHTKFMDTISSAIALSQVDLATKIKGVKTILGYIYSLYIKLCDVDFFTQETQ